MEDCPNIRNCKLVSTIGFVDDETRRLKYMETYCSNGAQKWNTCFRFRVKKELNLCPDFLLPDSDLTMDEILDRMEEES